jgi:DNA-binding SARP family transcriptional activator/tetratricopeptide (TPR) repeat protein
MEFRILGPLDVVEGEHVVALPGVKHRALLAMLLLHANEVVSTERLIDALWNGDGPQRAHKTLQVYVSQLRKALGKQRVHTRAPGYLVHVDDDELDLARFERLVEDGRLRDALALWRGPPLAEFADEPFAQGEIARLEERRLTCVERRVEHDLAAGRHAELVAELEALVQDHPLREQARAQLMLALYRSGRQAEALETYRDARRSLVDELGIEPGRSLRELEKAILEQHASLDFVSADASRGAFVGREAELKELLGGLEAAVAGRGQLFLLSGEPGIGKSRLADEVIREARARGARILTGRCWEAGGAPAYWPWVQSLRAYVREAPPELLEADLGAGAVAMAQILPELRELIPGLPEPASPDSEAAQFSLLDATAEFLRAASARRPIVLVLDDLHAADAPSLVLLRFLARELEAAHLLVLGALRDIDPVPGRPLTEMLVEAAREPGTRRLTLGGLSESDVGEYVERTAPAIASPELAAALHAETEGNPLFVGETVRLLSLEGIDPRASGDLRLVIPQNVRDVIARRLTHLSEECNRVLILASVLGREFAVDDLAESAALSVDDLLDLLDEATEARVVSDVPGAAGRLRFAHVLIRDTLYDRLAPARRARLHRLCAESLEGGREETPEHVLALAEHWFRAGVPERAITWYRRGAELALRVFAYYEAAEALTRAIDVLRTTPEGTRRDEEELELTIMLGATGDWAAPAFARARDLSVELGLALEPPILRGLALNSLLRLDFAQTREHAAALLAAGAREADPMVVVEGEYVIGVTAFWQGAFQESRRHLEDAIALYAPDRGESHVAVYAQDPRIVCLSRLAWVLWLLGHPSEAVEARDSALVLAEELGHPFSRCYAGIYAAIVSQELDDEPRRAGLVEASETLATDEGFDLLRAWAAVLRHWTLARRGDRDAIDAMKAEIDRLEETRQPLLNTYFFSLLARAYLAAGEAAPGLEAVTYALADVQRIGIRYMESELQRVRAELLVASGAGAADIADAFDLAHETARRQDAKSLEVRAADALTRWHESCVERTMRPA